MAGCKDAEFAELVSPYLKDKLSELESRHGKDSTPWKAIALQYLKSPREELVGLDERQRHYQSELRVMFRGQPVAGVERLYRRTILVEPTTACAAHCRWCLRGQYPIRTLKAEEIDLAAAYIGEAPECGDIEEVLITGGDPLMVPKLLRRTIEAIRDRAPQVRKFRIGTRTPFQEPDRVDDAVLSALAPRRDGEIEIAVNINHPEEFWSESVACIDRLQSIGLRLYNQHPLLKGVNDDLDMLIRLYDSLRRYGIEAHYLFHAVPMVGMSHHRTSLERGAHLTSLLCSCGEFSGRAKPRYAAMTDIGKIVLVEGSVLQRRGDKILLQSGYRAADRMRWCPGVDIPSTAFADEDGYLRVWYQDGQDDLPE